MRWKLHLSATAGVGSLQVTISQNYSSQHTSLVSHAGWCCWGLYSDSRLNITVSPPLASIYKAVSLFVFQCIRSFQVKATMQKSFKCHSRLSRLSDCPSFSLLFSGEVYRKLQQIYRGKTSSLLSKFITTCS